MSTAEFYFEESEFKKELESGVQDLLVGSVTPVPLVLTLIVVLMFLLASAII
jgi:hypothetical protein